MELARAVDEPADDAPPEWWDLLAEGHLRLGDPTRAGRLEAKGADRAEALGPDRPGRLAPVQGGGLPVRGREVRRGRPMALAGSWTRRGPPATSGPGRGCSGPWPGAGPWPPGSRARRGRPTSEALEAQVRDFPDEPSTGEARWLLGQLRLASGRPRRGPGPLVAASLTAIPDGWRPACSSADLLREAVEDQRINRDASATRARMEDARRSLRVGPRRGEPRGGVGRPDAPARPAGADPGRRRARRGPGRLRPAPPGGRQPRPAPAGPALPDGGAGPGRAIGRGRAGRAGRGPDRHPADLLPALRLARPVGGRGRIRGQPGAGSA